MTGNILSGTPPKPTQLKLIEGNRGRRPLNEKEPKPLPTPERRPAWLRLRAKQFWAKYAPILKRLGLLTELDGPALILLAESYADFRECLQIVRDEGFTFIAPTGYRMTRPEVHIMVKARKSMETMLSHFGMSPAMRSKVMVDLDKEMDEFEDLLDR